MLHIKKSMIWVLAVLMVFMSVGCNAPAENDDTVPPDPQGVQDSLMNEYPAFFGLDSTNGLDIFVAKFAPDVYSCSLYPAGQISTDSPELLDTNRVDLATMKEIVALYDLPADAFNIIPYQNALSSYIAPDLFRDGAIAQLRYELGLGEKPEETVQPEDTDDAPFPYTLCWAGYNDDGEYALRYTYYPITSAYDYQNELTYPAIGIKNTEELESFLSLARGYFSLSASTADKETFNESVKKFDEAFFQENGIVIVYIPSESTSIRYTLADAVLDGEELYITVAEKRPEETMDSAMAGWFMTVELPQEVISQANYFSAGN